MSSMTKHITDILNNAYRQSPNFVKVKQLEMWQNVLGIFGIIVVILIVALLITLIVNKKGCELLAKKKKLIFGSVFLVVLSLGASGVGLEQLQTHEEQKVIESVTQRKEIKEFCKSYPYFAYDNKKIVFARNKKDIEKCLKRKEFSVNSENAPIIKLDNRKLSPVKDYTDFKFVSSKTKITETSNQFKNYVIQEIWKNEM